MRSLRSLEMTMLGYRIERIEEHDQLGIPLSREGSEAANIT